MQTPAFFWAKVTLRLALVLLAIGLVPLLLQQLVWQDLDPLLPFLLSLTMAPLGGLCLVVAIILFLAAWVRRPR